MNNGKLILVSVPIGNLRDLSVRAREALEDGKNFAVEDTRVFRSLLQHLDISAEGKIYHSFYDYSRKKDKIFKEVFERGENLYLVSDAGSPILNDPGYPLICLALEWGIEIETLPGPSAVNVALELSGLPPVPFAFHGFIPKEKGKRHQEIERIQKCPLRLTHVYFISPHQLIETLKDLCAAFPQADFALARELTKKFQSVYRFQGSDWEAYKDQVTIKGEFVLLFHLRPVEETIRWSAIEECAKEVLENPGHKKKLSKLLGFVLRESSKEIYAKINKLG